MCGRYTIVTKLEAIEKRFNVRSLAPENFTRNVNVSAGNIAPVITSEKPEILQFFQFGFTPSWSKKLTYQINARSEGDYNQENRMDYVGNMGILQKPFYRKAIRSQRCLVVADCFIEGPQKEKLNQPYVVYLRNNQRPFAFAGIYDSWINHTTSEVIDTFAIITTSANELLHEIGHHRSPVILAREDEEKWIDSTLPLNDVTAMLKPYPTNEMNAYSISPDIKNSKLNYIELLEPTGQRLIKEYDYKIYEELQLQGMGMTTSRRNKIIEEEKNKNTPGQQGRLPF